MPELPEVETVVRSLRPKLEGRRIADIWAGPKKLRLPWRKAWTSRLAGRTILRLRRRAKWILMELDKQETLLVHLGMTGRLAVSPADVDREKHTHFVARLADGAEELRYLDPRRFGRVALCTAAETQELLAGDKLGPEPWDLTSEWLAGRLAGTARCLKACLLDQTFFAGVGNIYADEALFEARLHPGRPGCSLDAAETERLRRAVVKALDRAIGKHGSTILNFYYGNGEQGSYQHEFRAYGRTHKPCRRCRTPIAEVRLAGRATHFCPKCQAHR